MQTRRVTRDEQRERLLDVKGLVKHEIIFQLFFPFFAKTKASRSLCLTNALNDSASDWKSAIRLTGTNQLRPVERAARFSLQTSRCSSQMFSTLNMVIGKALSRFFENYVKIR